MRKVLWLVIALMAIALLAGCSIPAGTHTANSTTSIDGGAPVAVNADLEVADSGAYTLTVRGSSVPLIAGSPAAGAPAAATPASVGADAVCDPLDWELTDVVAALVPEVRERAFVAAPRLNGDQWIVETAKTAYDRDGHPCCGPIVTWDTSATGLFHYWNDQNTSTPQFNAPTGTGFTSTSSTDPTSGHKNWEVIASAGSTGTFLSDGVSWTPCPAGSAAASAAPAPAAAATPTPAAVSAPDINLGGLSMATLEEVIAWTGITGWTPTDGGEFFLHLDSPVQVCFTEDFPEGAYLKYGADPDGDGNWTETYVEGAGDCTVNTVAEVTFALGFPKK